MRDEATKVATNNAVPCWAFPVVKSLLDMLRNVLHDCLSAEASYSSLPSKLSPVTGVYARSRSWEGLGGNMHLLDGELSHGLLSYCVLSIS